MKQFQFSQFGLEHLRTDDVPAPAPGPGEVAVDIKALSLNYRDLMIVEGQYNPRLPLPLVPISDGAGVVTSLGDGVASVTAGQHVVIQGVPSWLDGPFRYEYHKDVVGCSRPGLAAETVVLPESAILPIPDTLTMTEAATLPTAGLTAWNCLVEHGRIQGGQTILTLGTGGVSIFALQLGKTMGAKVIITSSSDAKLDRARELGADHCINYRTEPRWEKIVTEITGGVGVDLTLETAGAGTLEQSMRATRANGTIAFLGSLNGLKAEIDLRFVLMKRLRIEGIYVGSRSDFSEFNTFLGEHQIHPVIDRVFPFEELRDALRHLKSGGHLGKVVVEV